MLTQNSAYVGLSGLFALVPLIVFRLLGGAWADAMDRRILLIIASCGLAAASLLLWLQAALALNGVWVVLWLLAVEQAFYAVNSPTRSARGRLQRVFVVLIAALAVPAFTYYRAPTRHLSG